ncbi:iron-containing alcohol dehydrogenase, partial [Mesorhizobium sp. M2D.F.Ca.ET.160.01.1.1]
EVTPILGQTEGGAKTTLRSPRVLPEVVIYDPELTLGLPVGMSVTSGLNAIAHAAEGLYAEDRNPITSMMAAEGMRALKEARPVIVASPHDAEARAKALYGAWLC